MDSKQFFEKLRKTKLMFNERRKQFKEVSQEEKILKVIKEMRDTSTVEARNRAALLDRMDRANSLIAGGGHIFDHAGGGVVRQLMADNIFGIGGEAHESWE